MSKQYEIEGQKFHSLTAICRVANRNTRQSWWLFRCDCGNDIEFKGLDVVRGARKCCGEGCPHKPPSYNYIGCGSLSGKYWGRINRHARLRDIPVEITIEDAWHKFVEQDGICALSGLEITLYRKIKTQTGSLDRIDSKKAYTIDNIQWVHKDINKMKSNLPEDRLLFLCEQIVAYCTKKDADCIL